MEAFSEQAVDRVAPSESQSGSLRLARAASNIVTAAVACIGRYLVGPVASSWRESNPLESSCTTPLEALTSGNTGLPTGSVWLDRLVR
ncbi:hypothetical protein [Cellulomonas sp. ATA003]|uniref:hypothetical protein n=1 Tax=Cellulomonas sp. ATA003 TaxID=3073064 RepID=UPI00287317DF|nr:hypothetical protein [Cellulomonas sp. ATA003]WNB86470.1 hypothetical protein REH70_04315 [Cellulomonas sp. ATA003]